MIRVAAIALLLGAMVFAPAAVPAQVTTDVPAGRPDAIVDLGTSQGASLVRAEWRYRDASVVDAAHRFAGADLKPTGADSRTHDVEPKAGAAAFDDSTWEKIAPETLGGRRGPGRLSFAWYRLKFTVPERLGAFDVRGTSAVFEIVVDDYAEIYVNGALPVVPGSSGGRFPRGYNAPNRVLVGRDLQPGQQFTIAVFAANGPMSNPPANYIWIRLATLDFYKPGRIGNATEVATEILRKDPALDAIVPVGAKIEKLAGGFTFTEGPVWVKDGGYLLFSDPNENNIYKWTPDGQVDVFRTKSGYAGVDIHEYFQPGSNGLTLDAEGRLTVAEHGNRRIVRIERNGVVTVLANAFEGRRLNSPNDLVYRSDGSLYFTDPPFGLPKVFDDRRRELPHSGVYRLKDGKLDLLTKDFTGPNGLAFSPDEKFLYVANWDPKQKAVKRYPVLADGRLGEGTTFFDLTVLVPGEIALDGLKVDRMSNVYLSGPGGVWIIDPAGRHLGTIRGPEDPANFTFGDADGRTLYLTARTGLYRIRLNVSGAGYPAAASEEVSNRVR